VVGTTQHEGEYAEFVFLVTILPHFEKTGQGLKVIMDADVKGGNVKE